MKKLLLLTCGLTAFHASAQSPAPKAPVRQRASAKKTSPAPSVAGAASAAGVRDSTGRLAGGAEGVAPLVADPKVYTYVEEMPELPGGGGPGAILAAVQKQCRYSALAWRNRVEGRVLVSFVVDGSGAVSAIKVEKGLGSGLDEETVAAVSRLPRFTAGKQHGQRVSVRFTLPITWAIQ